MGRSGHFQHLAPEADQALAHPPIRGRAWLIAISNDAPVPADRFRLECPRLAEKEIGYLREFSDLFYRIFRHHRPIRAAERALCHAPADLYAEVFLSALSQR